MEYNTFKEVVSERICDYLPPVFNNYYPVIESVNKINEKKDALTLRTEDMDERMAMPVIYLDDMYDVFRASQDIDDLLECAAEIIVNFANGVRGLSTVHSVCEYALIHSRHEK